MEYVVDIQGFTRSSNLFVLKELTILAVADDGVPITYLFRPPCKWVRLLEEEKRKNRWLEKKFHGIPWNSGSIPYCSLIRILNHTLRDATKIYVKGLEKKRWLEDIVHGK